VGLGSHYPSPTFVLGFEGRGVKQGGSPCGRANGEAVTFNAFSK
jgi:hypothetical protein